MRLKFFLKLVLLGVAMITVRVDAHPLAPALLELQESSPGRFSVLWRTSASRAMSRNVEPRLPETCTELKPPQVSMEGGEALVARWTVQCDAQGLIGKTITVHGLAESGINVILRIGLSQGEVKTLLDADQASFVVPAPEAAKPVLWSYLHLGIEHLLTGFDHLLFVLGLLLLMPNLRNLIFTVTAFTLGHSITLSLASLGLIHVPQALAELGIAATILLLATELVRRSNNGSSWIRRRPWLMAALFGLVHGLGFAGALREIGLPQDEIPLSLFAFNIGIEIGQLLLVTLALLLTTLWRRAPQRLLAKVDVAARAAPAYFIGSLAAFWCFERFAALLA